MSFVDVYGIERVDEIKDLEFYALRCAAKWNHPFDGGFTVGPAEGWPNAEAVTEKCLCGRWRRRTIHKRTGELLTVAYGGGQMLTVREDVRKLYLAFVTRQRKALENADTP